MSDEKLSISLTKEQYRNLLLLTYIGSWVINAHNVESDDNEYDQLTDFIASHYKQFECGDLVEYDKELNADLPTLKLENCGQKFINEYDDISFWENLTDRFAERDFEQEISPDLAEKMSDEEFASLYTKLYQHYSDEFSEHGIDKLYMEGGLKFFYRPKNEPSQPKAGRNEVCPCGSGKKFKKCCASLMN